MFIITDEATLQSALDSPPPPACERILRFRRVLLSEATFFVVEPTDTFEEIQSALGFPISIHAPPWEWVLDHRGAFEAPVIHSDDGHGTVLIVPDELGMNQKLLSILRAYAQPAGIFEGNSGQADQPKPQ